MFSAQGPDEKFLFLCARVFVCLCAFVLCEQFEKAFEDTDVMAQTVQGTMDNSTAMSTPAHEVEDLLKQLADEAQLDMSAAFPNAQGVRVPAQAAPAEEEVRV